jgi:hypothetical protein
MSSFLFYDPNDLHRESELDEYIFYIKSIQIPDNLINPNNNLQQVVCICSRNKSSVIQEIQAKEHIVLIFPCNNKDHGGPETDPDFGPKVPLSSDILLTPNSGWEFKGRSALLESCIKRGYHQQGLNELQMLKKIQLRSLSKFEQAAEAT